MKKEVLRRALGRAFGIMGTLLMAGIFVLESHYANTLPRSPDRGAGRVYPLSVHGIVYLTSGEKHLDKSLEISAAACLVLFALLVYPEIRRRNRSASK